MGSHSYTDKCPKCGNEMNCYNETRQQDVSGECLYCGYLYYTKHDKMTLEEVNSLRTDFEMEQLTELHKQDGN